MKIVEDFDNLMATYNKLLKQCHDALDPAAPQRSRNELRAALGKFLERGQSNKAGTDSSGGSK